MDKNNSNKKKKNKKASGIALIVGLSIVLAGSITFLVMILTTNIFFKSSLKTDNDTEDNEDVENDSTEQVVIGEDSTLEANFTGDYLLAGGQASKYDFDVEVTDENGKKVKVSDYTCTMLDDDYKMVAGTNTFIFNYNGLTAETSVNAVDPSTFAYAPNYVLYNTHNSSTEDKVAALENGSITYEEALENVSFTGDSQFEALVTYNLLTEDSVIAQVGASADYMEEQYSNIVAKSYGKDALVIHYGINSLSADATDRAQKLKYYMDIISRLKDDLKGTRIIVCGVFPVKSTTTSLKPSFAYIDQYDQAILEECMYLGVEYYSNNEFLVANQQYFSDDGIHLQPDFYRSYWVKNLIETMGL